MIFHCFGLANRNQSDKESDVDHRLLGKKPARSKLRVHLNPNGRFPFAV